MTDAYTPNRTPCGAYLKTDIMPGSGERMRSHINECEECQAILERERVEREREE